MSWLARASAGSAFSRNCGAITPMRDQEREEAVSAASTITACRPDSSSVSTSRKGAGWPEKKLPTLSTVWENQRSKPRNTSEVPTTSCQRSITSERSIWPSEVASIICRCASLYISKMVASSWLAKSSRRCLVTTAASTFANAPSTAPATVLPATARRAALS